MSQAPGLPGPPTGSGSQPPSKPPTSPAPASPGKPQKPGNQSDAAADRQPVPCRYTKVADTIEARLYDYKSARPPSKKTNIIESIAHLIKSALGGGVVSIHSVYSAVGIWTGLILNPILGFCVGYLMYVLQDSAHKIYGRVAVPKMSYPDLAEASFCISPFHSLRKYAKFFRYLVDATIMIDLFGSCCCYQLLIAESIKQLVEELNPDAVMSKRLYVLMLLIPCILICMIRTLKYLAPLSIVANCLIVLVSITTVVYGFRSTLDISTFPAFTNADSLMLFIGVCVFSMEGVGVTMPIENNMLEPEKMPLVLFVGMTVIVAIVILVGFFGSWAFGVAAKAPVTLNFPFNVYTIFLKAGLAGMVYVTFALNFWVPFELVWHYIAPRYPPEKHYIWERVYRAGVVFIVTMISVAFPAVEQLMGVIGSFCLSNMGFIYPSFIELLLDWEVPGMGRYKWRLIKFIVILAFGLFLMFYGTYSNVKQLLREAFGAHTVTNTTLSTAA